MQSNMKEFTDTQLHQENSYHIPYHYGSLISKEDMLNNFSQHARYQNVIKRIKEFKNNSIKVLDIGCGDGRFAYDLSKEEDLKIEYTGIDYSNNALNFAKVFNPHYRFINIDLSKFSLDSKNKFDVIVLIEVIEHIQPERLNDFLTNVSLLLKEDGITIITCPSKNIRIPKKHYQHFTEHSLRETLAKHFNSIQISGYFNKNKFLKLVISLIIYLPHLLYLSKRRNAFFNLSIKLSRNFFASFMNESNYKNALGLISVCRK